jgi:hypothetical protein
VGIAQVISIINQMQTDRIVDRYAIGGAVGATFYIEPVATLDVDVFVSFHQLANQALLNLQPIYDYLTLRGAIIRGEYIELSGWPVQFLPSTNPLVEEALNNAVIIDVEGTPARVFTAEHLAAIALQTGRAKDHARLVQLIEAAIVNPEKFRDIVRRHGLADRWQQFEQRFLRDSR